MGPCGNNGPGGNNGPRGNMGPGNMKRNLRGNNRKLQQSQCSNFHINIFGGDIYV